MIFFENYIKAIKILKKNISNMNIEKNREDELPLKEGIRLLLNVWVDPLGRSIKPLQLKNSTLR